jgi:hypothetical protein
MAQSKTYPRDVFLYLLSIITLITIAVSLGILIYQYINLQNPDVLNGGYYSIAGVYGSIRNSMAVLMVVFPVFIWVSWFLRKDIGKNPEKRELKIRRWLLYLTLFAASLVIIGDLVALLINFLNGELTMRFILKVVTVFAIAGSIFVHYFSELREKPFGWVGIFDKVLIVAVAASVVSGFWIAGSPAQQRAVRIDEQRVQDLSAIQYQIIDYWQRKRMLPGNLSELNNSITGFNVPKDPETGNSYSYRQTGSLSFELCAVFTSANSPDYNSSEARTAPIKMGYNEINWSHGPGAACFERRIDPDYFPPLNDGVVPKPVVQ